MGSHSRIVVLYTLSRVSEIAGDVIHRPVRRAQVIQFTFDRWSKADRRHAPNVARRFSVGNRVLPIDDEFAYEIDPEAREQVLGPASQPVFVVVALGVPGFPGNECSGVNTCQSWDRDHSIAALRS